MKSETKDLARRSLALFGVEGSLTRISWGLDASYRVKAVDGRAFALRVSSGIEIRRVSAFRVEAKWIDELASSGWFRVPGVERTKEGDLIGVVEDEEGVARASTLLSWIPGRRRYRIGAEQARKLGRMAGALHRHARIAGPVPAGAIKTWDARFICTARKAALHRFGSEVRDVVERTRTHMGRILPGLGPDEVGLINADLGLHNVVWHEGYPGLVDFNDAGIGPYAFCLGRLTERVRRSGDGDVLVEELLDGYREVAPLPAAYRQWGGLFEAAAAVFGLNCGQARVDQRGVALSGRERQTVADVMALLHELG